MAIGGCGGSNPNAPLVIATRDASTARSFQIAGAAVIPRYGRMTFDVQVVRNRGLKGTYGIAGVHLGVIGVNGNTYIKYRAGRNARFLGAVIPRALTSRWIENISSRLASQMARVVDLSKDFAAAATNTSAFHRFGSTTVNGAQALRFDSHREGTITVGPGPKPYPLTLAIPLRGLQASFSHWNQPVKLAAPAGAVSASQLKRPPKVQTRTIATGTVLPSTPHNGVRTFRAAGYAIEFDYPEQMVVSPLGADKVAGTNRNVSHVALAIDRFSLIAVSQFRGLSIPVNAANVRVLSPPFARAVNALAGHSDAMKISSAHGVPLLRFAPFHSTTEGTPLTERIFDAFVGDDEYELNCQFIAADEDTIARACDTAIATLRHR
jgi:hypothetical protein